MPANGSADGRPMTGSGGHQVLRAFAIVTGDTGYWIIRFRG
jgi:hypothetical protein